MSKQSKLLNIEEFLSSTITNIDENINELPLNSISVKTCIFMYIYNICEINYVIHL
jgi:hypothetical protein